MSFSHISGTKRQAGWVEDPEWTDPEPDAYVIRDGERWAAEPAPFAGKLSPSWTGSVQCAKRFASKREALDYLRDWLIPGQIEGAPNP